MSGILAPLAGKTISCTYFSTVVYAYVDADGNPYTRVNHKPSSTDTGWVPGFEAHAVQATGMSRGFATWGASQFPRLALFSSPGDVGAGGALCIAFWPVN